MQTNIMILFTRTPLHIGSGSAIGAIDLPVARERHTMHPIIPGSAIKGVLSDEYLSPNRKSLTPLGEILFGVASCDESDQGETEDGRFAARAEKTSKDAPGQEPESKTGVGRFAARAGAISFGEARLLAFPLRSAKGAYALATSPLALARYKRDKGLDFKIPDVADGECLAGEKVVLNGDHVVLEEYVFEWKKDFPSDWAIELSGVLDDEILKDAEKRFVLLSDGDFSHFAATACQVEHHNRIKDETGVVKDGALFSVETVPSETLFYAPLHVVRPSDETKELADRFKTETLLQFGGKSTTGLGFCTVKILGNGEEKGN